MLTCNRALSRPYIMLCIYTITNLMSYARSKRGRESLSSQEGSSKTKKAKVTDNGEAESLEDVSTTRQA